VTWKEVLLSDVSFPTFINFQFFFPPSVPVFEILGLGEKKVLSRRSRFPGSGLFLFMRHAALPPTSTTALGFARYCRKDQIIETNNSHKKLRLVKKSFFLVVMGVDSELK